MSIGHLQSHLHHFEILHHSLHDIQLHGNHCLCNQPLFSTTAWSSGCNTGACEHIKCLCSLLAHSDHSKSVSVLLSSCNFSGQDWWKWCSSLVIFMGELLDDLYPGSSTYPLDPIVHLMNWMRVSRREMIYKFSFPTMTLSRRLILSRAMGQERLPHPWLIANTDTTQQRGIHHVVCLCQPHSQLFHLLISLVCYKNNKVFFKNFSVNSNS